MLTYVIVSQFGSIAVSGRAILTAIVQAVAKEILAGDADAVAEAAVVAIAVIVAVVIPTEAATAYGVISGFLALTICAAIVCFPVMIWLWIEAAAIVPF